MPLWVEQRSLAIGATLAARGKPGDRAILLYAPGLDFIMGFIGCLSAGMIAVSATPPDPSRIKRTLGRLRNIVADCEPRFIITTADFARQARAMFGMAPELAQLEWIATDEIPGDDSAILETVSAQAEPHQARWIKAADLKTMLGAGDAPDGGSFEDWSQIAVTGLFAKAE